MIKLQACQMRSDEKTQSKPSMSPIMSSAEPTDSVSFLSVSHDRTNSTGSNNFHRLDPIPEQNQEESRKNSAEVAREGSIKNLFYNPKSAFHNRDMSRTSKATELLIVLEASCESPQREMESKGSLTASKERIMENSSEPQTNEKNE